MKQKNIKVGDTYFIKISRPNLIRKNKGTSFIVASISDNEEANIGSFIYTSYGGMTIQANHLALKPCIKENCPCKGVNKK